MVRAGLPGSSRVSRGSGVRPRRSGESSAITRFWQHRRRAPGRMLHGGLRGRGRRAALMRVLALADQRPPLDPALMARRLHADAVVLLGDLDRAWIESVASLRVPRVGVHGNHDPDDLLAELDVEDLHGRRTSVGSMTLAG